MSNSNIYTFSADNIINNIDFNNMTGGLGYENVYDMIKNSIYMPQPDSKFEAHSKSFYNPDERVKTCKTSTKPKLRCDSGKLLKYLIRLELQNYQNALKKYNKDKDKFEKYDKQVKNGKFPDKPVSAPAPLKKEDYLRIIKPYVKKQGTEPEDKDKSEYVTDLEEKKKRLSGNKSECDTIKEKITELKNKIQDTIAKINDKSESYKVKSNKLKLENLRAELAKTEIDYKTCIKKSQINTPMFFKDKSC